MVAPPKATSEWEEPETGGEFIRFEAPNQSVDGTLLSKTTVTMANAEVGKYVLSTGNPDPEKDKVSFLGSVILDQFFEPIEVGTKVRVTYLGTEKTNQGRNVKQFSVQRAKV